MPYGARIGYLGLNVFLPTVPASFFTFSQYPIYALYELAPRVSGISAVADQRVAGLLMKLCGGAILFGTMSVMFFRWYRREADADADAVRVPG
jgi:putative membrane protein